MPVLRVLAAVTADGGAPIEETLSDSSGGLFWWFPVTFTEELRLWPRGEDRLLLSLGPYL